MSYTGDSFFFQFEWFTANINEMCTIVVINFLSESDCLLSYDDDDGGDDDDDDDYRPARRKI
jgi:hypothetical protein